jgi:HSP20 family protein
MDLMRWDPFGDLGTLRDRVNRAFEDAFARTGTREPAEARTWSPPVDIQETEGEIVLRADLPGMTREQIDIELSGDALTIRGERTFDDEGRNYLRVERPHGTFQRGFTIGVPIDQANVKANFRDGVLEITLPKSEEIRPKQVKIDVG